MTENPDEINKLVLGKLYVFNGSKAFGHSVGLFVSRDYNMQSKIAELHAGDLFVLITHTPLTPPNNSKHDPLVELKILTKDGIVGYAILALNSEFKRLL